MRRLLLPLLLFPLVLTAQTARRAPVTRRPPADEPLLLVRAAGPGAIRLPDLSLWQPEVADVYDHGNRPVVELRNAHLGVTASYILFNTQSGHATPQGCRDEALSSVVSRLGQLVSQRRDGTAPGQNGSTLATSSYQLAVEGTKLSQHNLFAFAGDGTTCAELHLSTVPGRADDAAAMQAGLATFHPELALQPNALQLFVLARILEMNSPALAVPYYKASLALLPPGPATLQQRRIATDQYVMDLGISGDLAGSKAAANQAIAADPDYPLNYYNLADADAESGDPRAARQHLEQAFARRGNTLPGETLPDPTRDDSLRKLKDDPAFWAFVQTLH